MPEETSQEHRVTIFTHGGVGKVWPPYLVVKAGDSVVFKTVGTSVTIIFPHAQAFDPGGSEPDNFEVSSNGSALLRIDVDDSGRVLTQADMDKVDLKGLGERTRGSTVTDLGYQIYAYSVYCDSVNDMAQGQSSPVMIIEPPEDRPPP
jgi:hypothetical protein